MNTDILDVRYELTTADYERFARFSTADPARRRMNPWLARVGAGIVFAAALNAAVGPASVSMDLFVMALGTVLCISVEWANRMERRNAARRMFKHEAKSGLTGEILVQISEEGLGCSDSSIRVLGKWAAVTRIVERDGDVYFFIRGESRLAVPRSAFMDDQARQRFLSAARRFREEAAGLEPATGGYLP